MNKEKTIRVPKQLVRDLSDKGISKTLFMGILQDVVGGTKKPRDLKTFLQSNLIRD
jgi:hypothetical protein